MVRFQASASSAPIGKAGWKGVGLLFEAKGDKLPFHSVSERLSMPPGFVWRPRDVLRSFIEALDVIPYIMILAYPFAFFAWVLGLMGEPPPGTKAGDSWWFVGYVVALLYLPVLGVCALAERWARKRGHAHVLTTARIVRWAHFLVTFGPVIFLAVVIMLPPAWQPI